MVQPPRGYFAACRRWRIAPSRHLLVVSVARQRLEWFERSGPPTPPTHGRAAFRHRACYRASTSLFGIGQIRGSNRTPLGLLCVSRKIGGGWPVGTVFRARQPTGFTWAGQPAATIAHRILWLAGLEPGFNRGGDVDTFSRFIYVHGLGDEPTLGRPASHGCVHLAAADLMPLFDRVPAGTHVWINEAP